MAKLITGTSNAIGHTPVVKNLPVAAAIAAGTAVSMAATTGLATAGGTKPVGFVMNSLGKAEIASGVQSIAYSSFDFIALADSGNAPAAGDIGDYAKVSSAGLVTTDSGTATAAVIKSAAFDAYPLNADGTVSDTSVKAVFIDFPHGL